MAAVREAASAGKRLHSSLGFPARGNCSRHPLLSSLILPLIASGGARGTRGPSVPAGPHRLACYPESIGFEGGTMKSRRAFLQCVLAFCGLSLLVCPVHAGGSQIPTGAVRDLSSGSMPQVELATVDTPLLNREPVGVAGELAESGDGESAAATRGGDSDIQQQTQAEPVDPALFGQRKGTATALFLLQIVEVVFAVWFASGG